MIAETIEFVKGLWNMIPPDLRDWSKSEVLNFIQKNAPDFFQFCKDKLNRLWAKVPDSKIKSTVDRATSSFLALNDKIPPGLKQQLFEQVTGSQYNPDPNCNMQVLSEVVQTDDAKKAATVQMAYLIAIFGEINQKQEFMLEEYMNSLRISEKLKQEILNELQEAKKEFEKFAKELSRLDSEFERTSAVTAKAKKEANDIIDLI